MALEWLDLIQMELETASSLTVTLKPVVQKLIGVVLSISCLMWWWRNIASAETTLQVRLIEVVWFMISIS